MRCLLYRRVSRDLIHGMWAFLIAGGLCSLCGCDTSVKRRVSATYGMSIDQVAQREPNATGHAHWAPAEPYREPPRVATGMVAADGAPITVSCASCHANLQPNTELAAAEDLREFHQGLHYRHGVVGSVTTAAAEAPSFRDELAGLTCLTCHHGDNYNQLRLADGRPVEFYQSRRVCAQCHAPQHRDYEHGAHGGMSGYWDRERGEVVRKTCVDCHDPHAPQFPAMHRTFRPLDRFLAPHGKGPLEGAAHE